MTQTAIVERWPEALAPTEAFARLADRRGIFWLDSSLPRAGDGRYSIMGCDPNWQFTARGAQWCWEHADGRVEKGDSSPLERLENLLHETAVTPPTDRSELPFWGGAVGWLSYDLGRTFEQIGEHAVDDLACPDIQLAWYDSAVIWDHQTGDRWLVATEEAAITALKAILREPVKTQSVNGKTPAVIKAVSNFSRAEYMSRVTEAREGIARGEYYQLNLVQRFECALQDSPEQIYRRLRELNPAPFSAYLKTGEWTVLSSSPERFLEVSPMGEIRTCPIKGTRPRGQTMAEDVVLKTELLANEKERAELLMIVDMLRNDLGRVCEFGSVAVQRLHALETFATVHHLVGEVTGRLRSGVGWAELLRAVFPGGSITGAPKVSAMRAIEHLEPHRRGLGMGAIGYFSAHGRIDFNIAIRTIMVRADRAYVPVGAGIVADSDPAAEYAETLAKARALFAALGVDGGEGVKCAINGKIGNEPASGMSDLPDELGVYETLLVRAGELVFFDEHWERLTAGARLQGWTLPFGKEAFAAFAQELLHENCLRDGVCRVAAWPQASRVEWRVEVSPPRPHMARSPWRVQDGGAILPLVTPDHVCKHLRRTAWTHALRTARAAGWDETILSDVDGRLVEGGVSNVFFVRDGVLHTPSPSVGPLPGVMRAQVLALARAQGWPVQEGVYSAVDLTAASELWLTNSLIGIRPVADWAGRPLDSSTPILSRLRQAWQADYGWDPVVILSAGT